MLGGIYGDKAGSVYEYDQVQKVSSVKTETLITKDSFYSDDTIEIIAIMDAIINNKDYEETLREYILRNIDYKPNYKPYFDRPFSPNTIKWAMGEKDNKSNGNGALMRISPVAYLFDKENEVAENSLLVTKTSHDTYEATASADILARLIFYFRKGMSKEDAYKALCIKPTYKPFKKFNMTCNETLNNCLYIIYNSNSFEDAIRKTLLMGGDTDTNCCIVGSVCEALYGMNEQQKQDAISSLPEDYIKILKRVYKNNI